jgi:di/tripeptidase
MTKSTLVVLVDVTATAEYDEEETPEGSVYNYRKGLNGGHSNGYSQGLGNANKIMNRLLFDGFDNFDYKLQLLQEEAFVMLFRVKANVLRVCILNLYMICNK